MSEITVGSPWKNRCDGVEAIVKNTGNDCVGFTQIINGKEYFYTHTLAEFKEYYEPKFKADMVNHPPHYKDASGVGCTEVVKHMMYFGGACFKYLYRCGSKWDDIEDLKKAIWYAERAWLGSEQVCDEANEKIGDIANHRTGHIQDAMLELADENWLEAIDAIDRELDMLGDTDD